jgi:endoglucanase
MISRLLLPLLLFGWTTLAQAVPAIKIDQFGYRPADPKIAVLSNPITGFNSAESYTPGATLQVRRVPAGTVVFSAAPVAWQSGAEHTQSGDQVWWFDFSSVTAWGVYEIHDPTTLTTSETFRIHPTVYHEVLRQAGRMLFYQRSGFAKTAAYAGAPWADGAAFLGAGQDPEARAVADQGNPATALDLQGGWFDAGDYNKYTTWAASAVQQLLHAYEESPTAFTDRWQIPESGNGTPDILDEVQWELDWLLRMQQGNGAVLSKVSVLLTQATSPPSADTRARFWGAASTAATAAAAAAFAQASVVYGRVGQTSYAATLLAAAEAAWTWVQANPAVGYANTGFQSASPEPDADYGRPMLVLQASSYLYAATGTAAYKTYFDANYAVAHPVAWTYWSGWELDLEDALLRYVAQAGGTSAVKTAITAAALASITSTEFRPARAAENDAYRAYVKDADYGWGSNQLKGLLGGVYLNVVHHGLDPSNAAADRAAAADYLHYLHGVNPMGLVYVSSMRRYGATNSVHDLAHSWFDYGTVWDGGAQYGPPAGYVTGGPNPSYEGSLEPPLNQPIQKSYLDGNDPDFMYQISEPSLAYQAPYIRLLASFAARTPTSLAVRVAR